jgi:hypothetical protein
MSLNALPEDRTQEISVLVGAESLTATEGLDFAFDDQRVSFGTLEDVPDSFPLPLTRTVALTLEVLPDLRMERAEDFLLRLSNPIGGRLGSTDDATVTILNQPPDSIVYLPITWVSPLPPTVQFVDISKTVNEETGKAVFEVEMSEPPETDVTVRYATTDQGTAKAGVDYVANTGVLTFTAGTTQTQQFEVEIIDNNTVGPATLIIVLEDPQGDARLSPSNSIATLIILDDQIEPTSFGSLPGVLLGSAAGKPLGLLPRTQQPPWALSSLLLPVPGGG